MKSTDIFNKHAVNCELSQVEVLLPHMAKHRSQQAVIWETRLVGGRRHLAPAAVAAAAVTALTTADPQTA